MVRRLEGNGLVVTQADNAKQEHWIPASLIPNSSVSRAWSFRPRKINADRIIPEAGASTSPGILGGGTKCLAPPCVSSAPTPIKANSGEIARLAVQVSQVIYAYSEIFQNSLWRKKTTIFWTGLSLLVSSYGQDRCRSVTFPLSLSL